MALKGSDLLVRSLEAEGVEYVFGIPGEENLDFVESLRKSKKIKLILTRHEQAAGFMAATIGRLSGKVGVCVSTLGPGATNFSTAIAYADLGGFPSFFITGQKPIRASKQGRFQIVDIVDHFSRISKKSVQVVDAGLIPSTVLELVRIAQREKPGPVHLELPEDIAELKADAPMFKVAPPRRPVPDEKAINLAIDMIKAAKRPILVIGAGANRKRTSKMLGEFVEKYQIPYTTTQMGKGVIPEDNKYFFGCAALSSNDYVHVAIEMSDLVIIVGHDVVEKPPFFCHHGSDPKVMSINFYESQIDPVYFPEMDVVGDIANAIWQLKEKLGDRPSNWDHEAMMKLQPRFKKAVSPRNDEAEKQFPMHPAKVVLDVRSVLPDDGIVCLDNGVYKIWFARCYEAKLSNTILLDNALATMGAGLPSAIAAKIMYPYRPVVAVAGDGGFMMNNSELETAVRLKLDLVVLIMNDNALGMIKWKQQKAGFEEWGLDLGNPNFVKYAESYGAKGHCVEKSEDFEGLLKKCIEEGGVHVIEVPTCYKNSDIYLNDTLPKEIAALRTELGTTNLVSADVVLNNTGAEAGKFVERN